MCRERSRLGFPTDTERTSRGIDTTCALFYRNDCVLRTFVAWWWTLLRPTGARFDGRRWRKDYGDRGKTGKGTMPVRLRLPRDVQNLVFPRDPYDLTGLTDSTVKAANSSRFRKNRAVEKFMQDLSATKKRILWRDYRSGKQRKTITRAALRSDAIARYFPDHYVGLRGTNCGTFARALFSTLTHRPVGDLQPSGPPTGKSPKVSVACFGYPGTRQGHWFVLVTDSRLRIYQSELNSFNFALASAVLRLRKVHPYRVGRKDLHAFLASDEIDPDLFRRLFHFSPPFPRRTEVTWFTAPLLDEYRTG